MTFTRCVFTLMLTIPTLVIASPGIVDDYDCHEGGPDNQYHCHGSDDAAKVSHLLIGGTFSADSWHYGNGPMNLFAGVGVAVELANDFVAGYARWASQPHYTGDSGYRLSGWQAGVKLGSGIARIGLHPYGQLGYFSQQYQLVDSRVFDLAGFQFGGGVIQNFKNAAVDFSISYRDPRPAQQIWVDLDAPGLTAHLSTQLTIALRL